jgi:hypothetical protein
MLSLYLGRTFTGWIAPAFGWRTYSITSSARAGRSSSELIFDLWNFLRPIFFGPIIPV